MFSLLTFICEHGTWSNHTTFLDHVNNELERRFPGDQWQMMLGQYLIPSKFDQVVYRVVDELSIVFWADLPDLVT